VSLRVEDVGIRLGGRRVLDRVRLRCDGGTLAIIGPNGVGKSTLLRIVAGIIVPDEGGVFLRGQRIERALRDVGYVPEKADPPPHLSVAELCALARALRRAPAPLPDATLDRLGVRAFWDQRVSTLSLGQRRRACLAAALVGDPWLLVLDEPTNGLDTGGMEMLADVLRAHQGGALVATHDRDFADRVGAERFELTCAPGPAASASRRREP
jgi:ABC-type multidrug transport system ATPase subunit